MGNQNSRNKRNINDKDNVKFEDKSEISTSILTKDPTNPTSSLTGLNSTGTATGEIHTQLDSIDKLSKILIEKSHHHNNNIKGISEDIFILNIFPKYPDLGHRLFNYFRKNSREQNEYLTGFNFKQQCEKFLGILDDNKILELYIKIFASEEDERPETLQIEALTKLLEICFAIAASNYTGPVKTCDLADKTISSIVDSVFYSHEFLTVGYVVNWFEANAARIIIHMHTYIVHILATAYRILEQKNDTEIYIRTVIDEPMPENILTENTLLPISRAWLLAGTLPYNTYTKLPNETVNKQIEAAKISTTINVPQPVFKDKLSLIPSHWTLLYDSNNHGMGANRFLHHVLGYRGATLVLLHTREEDQIYCIASPSEWKESNLYTGSADCCILSIYPRFSVLEKKPNLLYLNTCIRGYPKGLRAGSDPKNPIISVNEHFEKLEYKGISKELLKIEVWGCGTKSSRERQLDIKKWQIQEAERQRTVKLTAADWMDHPDRYLLEMGGRKNYN